MTAVPSSDVASAASGSQSGSDPWGKPLALVARSYWVSLDGIDPGDVQARTCEGGVQVRERCPCQVAQHEQDTLEQQPTPGRSSHQAESCLDCWTTPREIGSSSQWRPLTERLMIRVPSDDVIAGTRRVEVVRRTSRDAPTQAEVEWSAPWRLPRHHETEAYQLLGAQPQVLSRKADRLAWVQVAPDVQIYDGHGATGILVRRATRLEPQPEWATPALVPESYGQWVDLVPDGSLQVRFWIRDEGNDYGGWIEARQRTGRQTALTVEPQWGKCESGHGALRGVFHGYKLELLYRSSGYSHLRDVVGIAVTDSLGVRRDHEIVGYWILVAPDLRVEASSQGSFLFQYGTLEPLTARVAWSAPTRYALSAEWLYIGEDVRVRLEGGCWHGVHAELQQEDGSWQSDGAKPFGTAHELTPEVRLMVAQDHTIEVQYAAPANAQ